MSIDQETQNTRRFLQNTSLVIQKHLVFFNNTCISTLVTCDPWRPSPSLPPLTPDSLTDNPRHEWRSYCPSGYRVWSHSVTRVHCLDVYMGDLDFVLNFNKSFVTLTSFDHPVRDHVGYVKTSVVNSTYKWFSVKINKD